MYEPFFGMERRPFSATPDPGCFFSSHDLQAVLDELTVCVERGQGIGILTAAAGIGKTLLCQRLAASLRQRVESQSQFECVYLSNSNYPTRRSLLQAILFEMGDEYSRRDEPELRIDLRSRLLSLRPQREALVLIVDEAHLFSDELLEELRTLSDLADDGTSLVRIVLSGQHELEERLTDRSFDALNQRISKHVFAEPLTISESGDYIQHRLAWAGCDIEAVFSEEAIGIITRASGGVPRCLNQLSDHSLLLAFASDQKPVSEDTVREALEDLKQLPLHWNDVSDGTEVVGYVEGDDEETTAVFDGEVDDTSIDAEREAALLQLASEDTAVSTADVEDEPSADTEGVEFDDQSGIVESVESGVSASLAANEPAHAPALDGGFEFDFSDSKDDRSAVEPEGASSEIEHAQVSPQQSEFASDESAASVIVKPTAQSECEDPNETILQVLPQETILEARPRSDEEQAGTCDDAGISFQITSNGFEMDDFGPPEELGGDAIDTSANEENDGEESVSEKEFDSDCVVETASEDVSEVDSGVIEFSFSADSEREDGDPSGACEAANSIEESATPLVDEPVAFEELEPTGQTDESEVPTASAAEISLALFGQDAVLPEHKSELPEHKSDIVLPESVEAESQESVVFEQQTSAAEPVSEVLHTVEAAKTEQENSIDEEPDVINYAVRDESGCEEEFVYDPYAALQEPDGAGIVWDVANFSKHAATTEVAESSDEAVASAEAASNQPGEGIEFSKPTEAAERNLEPLAEEETSQDSSNDDSVTEFEGGLILDDTFEEEQTEEPAVALGFSAEESAAEALSDETLEITHLDIGELPTSEETVEAVDLPENVDRESGQDKAATLENEVVSEHAEVPVSNEWQDDDCEEAASFADDEHRDVHAGHDPGEHETAEHDISEQDIGEHDIGEHDISEHDIVQPVEERPLHPDRLVDAVLPLLAELDEDLQPVVRPGMTGRSVLDIEAELIQTTEHGSDELEDQIGATMLDICLDTHSALQDSAAAIRNAEAAELDSLNELDDVADELLNEPFDIVQPEPRGHDDSVGYELDPQFQERAGNANDEQITSEKPPKPNEKPFGKLFSELRRRNS